MWKLNHIAQGQNQTLCPPRLCKGLSLEKGPEAEEQEVEKAKDLGKEEEEERKGKEKVKSTRKGIRKRNVGRKGKGRKSLLCRNTDET